MGIDNESDSLVIARSACSILLLALVAAALSACGTGMGTPPPGGPPDTTAPRVVSSIPVSGTVGYSERTLTVEFSEYVEESGVPANVVITPIPATPPEYDWSGRTLYLTFQQPLLENRTYTVTFGAGIVDLNGNRLGRPFSIRFATGARIDSARIAGTVEGLAKRRAYVFAYQIPTDSTAFAASFRPDTLRPDFIAPVGDDGRFTVEGLPPGRFRLFAVADDANDQLFAPGTDAYGVPQSDTRIDSAGSIVTGVRIRLRPAPDDQTAPALYSVVSINRSRTELRFSEPIDTAGLAPSSVTIVTPAGVVAATALWRSPSNALALLASHPELASGADDTLHVTGMRDTVGNAMPDSSSHLPFTPSATPDTVPPALLPLGVDSTHAYTFPDSLRIAFDEAVRIADTRGVVVLRDTGKGRVEFRLRRVSPALYIATPLDTLFGVARGTVEVALGRFTDEAGNRRDSTLRVPIAIGQIRQNGSMEGTITDSAAPASVHVVTARLSGTDRIYTLKNVRSGRWELANVPEGEYEVSAFRDENGNGVYDYGSVLPFSFGEPYISWRGTVRVRPRWVTNKVDLVFGRN